jgi:hypothetical protein
MIALQKHHYSPNNDLADAARLTGYRGALIGKIAFPSLMLPIQSHKLLPKQPFSEGSMQDWAIAWRRMGDRLAVPLKRNDRKNGGWRSVGGEPEDGDHISISWSIS